MIREVMDEVSKYGGCRYVMKIWQFLRTRQEGSSLGSDVPLCKECTHPRDEEDSRLVATLAQDEAIGPVRSVAIMFFFEKRCIRW